jgi:hypothetical protein
MDTPAYPHLNRVIAGGVTAEASRKKNAAFIPCNPLISLDSDERIQGNPRESNSH